MEDKIVVAMLNIITAEAEKSVLSKLESALSCQLTFAMEDEDLNKSWDCSILGLYFYIAYSHHRLHSENLYTLSIVSEAVCYPESENPDRVFLDFHFQRLLLAHGFTQVLTNDAYGQFLDSLE